MAELTRFLKDHGFSTKHITKEELAGLIRQINLKKIKRFDLTALSYPGFLEFVIQASYFIYSRKPFMMNNLPLVNLLKEFFDQMVLATKARGDSTILFDDPDSTALADPDLMKILNKKIAENPDYPVPEGFKKIKEFYLEYDYEVPNFIPMPEAQRDSLEILDDIIFSKFQFHFLEPVVKKKECTKIKPVIRREFPSAKKAVPRYLDSLEGVAKPKQLDKLSTPNVNKTKYFTQRKYNFTENMRLVMLSDKRECTREAAEVLCEILEACEKGLKTLPPRNKYGPGGLKNKVTMMKEQLAMHEFKLEKKKDKFLKKHNEKWKAELTAREDERKKELESTKGQRDAERKQKREARKKKYENIVKHNEERLKEKEEKLKEKVDEYKQRQREEREANKDKKEQKNVEHQEFLEKQKEKLQKEMESIVKEREELKKISEELKNKEKEAVDKVKTQVAQYFKTNKEKLMFDKKEKQDVAKFIQKPKVQEVLNKYDVPLRYFFEFYSRSEHHGITYELDQHMETMNYKEFIRFGYQTNIVPVLIPVEEMNHTFKLLVRERQDEKDDAKLQVLDYDYFIKALVRISAIAQDNIGGQKGKKLEEYMENINKEKAKNAKLKETLAKKYNTTKKKDNDNSLERDKGGETSGNETGRESQKSEKTELYKKGAKKPRRKIIKEGYKDQTLKNATVLKNVVSEAELLKRKSQNVNKIIQEGTKAEILEHLKKVKVEDKRVSRSVDVGIITYKTLEGLISYLQLLPEDNKYTLDKKLNQFVRTNVGVKPNKFMKQQKPQKVDQVDSDTDSDDNDKSSLNKSKTEKTEKTDNESDSDGKTNN